MKKIFLPVAALFAVGASFAQESGTTSEGFKKGDVFLSGNVGYYSRKNDLVKAHTITVMPSAGLFVSDNIVVGASLSYGTQKTENILGMPGTSESKNTHYSGGLFGRYYATPANKFSVFGNISAAYTHRKTENTGSSDRTGNGFSLDAGPGINYFLSSRFSLQTYIGVLYYTSTKTKTTAAENKESEFGIDLNLQQLAFGVVYKL
jgi:hypothetical protein